MTPLLPVLPVPRIPSWGESLDTRRWNRDHYADALTEAGWEVRPAHGDGAGQTQGWLRVNSELVRVVLDPQQRVLRGGWARVHLDLSAREIDALRAMCHRAAIRAERRAATRNYDHQPDQAAPDADKAEWLAQLAQRLADIAAGAPATVRAASDTISDNEPDTRLEGGTR